MARERKPERDESFLMSERWVRIEELGKLQPGTYIIKIVGWVCESEVWKFDGCSWRWRDSPKSPPHSILCRGNTPITIPEGS